MVGGVREYESESSAYMRKDMGGRVFWHKESKRNNKRVPLRRAVYVDERTALALGDRYQAGESLDDLFSSVKEEFQQTEGRLVYEVLGREGSTPELEISGIITTII